MVNKYGHGPRHLRESFRLTIDNLKKNARVANLELTDNDISAILEISSNDFYEYYDKDIAPVETFSLLRNHYGSLMPYTYTNIELHDEVEDPFNGEDEEGA